MEESASDSQNGCSQHENSTTRSRRKYRIGCALLPKKVSRYLTPAMFAAAASNDVELLRIDYDKGLDEQGPFDAIVHKLRPNKEWERKLLDYSKQHPGVAVIDRVDGIKTTQNRSTMLSPLHGDGILIQQPDGADDQICSVRVQAPTQVEIVEGTSLSEAHELLQSAGLKPPLLVKPLWTDGREGSHGLAVLHDLQALDRLLSGQVSADLQPPLVLQQFVEHGGELFKVYVLGKRTVVTHRPSLGDNYLGQEARRKGVLPLPRISCKSVYAAAGAPQPCSSGPSCSMPPDWVTHTLAATLRKRLGLQLFNFDLICPEEQQDADACLYYVIDINYFPGVDKIPDFEHVFVEFLRAACANKQQHQQQQQQQQQQHSDQQSEQQSWPQHIGMSDSNGSSPD